MQSVPDFVRNNSKKAWRKVDDGRIEMPDYPDRAVLEGVVNALIHRNYMEIGSEVHIDMFDDRIEIYSPGGMVSGISLAGKDLLKIPSKRRNPILADIFSRLKYMERRGSGFKKILADYEGQVEFDETKMPVFDADNDDFILTLYNLNYGTKFYSLAAIIAVGYRINSERATQFRTWATKVLDTFTKQGYVLDKSRLINGQIFDEDYFEHLIAEIQEIRASERRFYQKITDIYATAVDYDKNSQVTREFYATVQNKMHYAVHGNTAAEVIVARADHNKEHMGLKSWKNAPDGKIVKTDVSIAKNYLEKEELAELNEIVTMYLDYATRQARRHIPMTMEDWKTKLDAFLRFNDAEVLQDKGKVTAAIAKEFAESEFEKYRVIQDSLYESDFDKLMNDMENYGTTH